MKKFLKGTKENLTVLSAKVGHKTEEDPEFLEKEKLLKEVDDKLQRLQTATNAITKNFNDNKSVYSKLTSVMGASMGKDEIEIPAVSKALTDAHVSYLPKNAIAPLNAALTEVKRLKDIREKRKNAYVLLQSSDKSLAEARSKGKDTTHIESENETKKAKYQDLHQQFMDGVTELYENRNSIYKQVIAATVFYHNQVYRLICDELENACTLHDITFSDYDLAPIS